MTANKLFEEKQNLVYASIKQHFGSYIKADAIAKKNNMDLDDLIQVGQLVLWKLCLNYDPEKEKTFNAYVVKSIKWKISSELHMKGLPIKVSTNVSNAKRNNMAFQSIDFYCKDGEIENDFFAVSPVNVEEDALLSIEYEEALSTLDKEERFILTQKTFGFSDFEVAKKVEKSRSVISRIKNQAIKKINSDYTTKIKTTLQSGPRKKVSQVV